MDSHFQYPGMQRGIPCASPLFPQFGESRQFARSKASDNPGCKASKSKSGNRCGRASCGNSGNRQGRIMASKPAPVAQMNEDRAHGIARISVNFVRLIPRARDGGAAMSQDLRYCPALNWDSSWLWGSIVTTSPNPFRSVLHDGMP